MTDAKPKRRWFRFSLSSLLLLITAICLWLGLKMNQVRSIRLVVAEMNRVNGTIVFEHEQAAPGQAPYDPPGPKWLRQIFGDEFFEEVFQIHINDDAADDQTMALIARLPQVKEVVVISDGVTDKGLAALAEARGLRCLKPLSSRLTPACLRSLARAKDLQTLSFEIPVASVRVGHSCPVIDDSWLPEIAKLTQLQNLLLSDSQVTDAGLAALQTASALQLLDLRSTKVTQAGVDKLRRSIPNCRYWLDDP